MNAERERRGKKRRERERGARRTRAEDSESARLDRVAPSQRAKQRLTAGRKLLPEIVSIWQRIVPWHIARCQLAIIWPFIIFTRPPPFRNPRGLPVSSPLARPPLARTRTHSDRLTTTKRNATKLSLGPVAESQRPRNSTNSLAVRRFLGSFDRKHD